jgi:hypothetical protein
MRKSYTFALFLAFFMMPRASDAYVHSCEVRANAHSEWVKTNVCFRIPEQWAVAALEDILSFDHVAADEHFKRVKQAYFTEKGWNDFQVAMNKSRILEGLKQKDLSLYGMKEFQSDAEILITKREANYSATEVKIPMFLFYGPATGTLGYPKRKDSVVVHITFSGPVNENWRYVGDVGGTFVPQYDFKIESYKVVTK